ncbi:ATP-binding protein [Streptomyces sp. NPDC086838]|uniref:ATP-binding protein n=1 Tax=Streptomyces sp. NPDC086838 TaxID=3365762 RepID=UPI0038201A87
MSAPLQAEPGAYLVVEVSDARGERRPELCAGGPDAEGGHGLRLVEALAAEWGVAERIVGKTVWARVAPGR